MKYPKVQLVIDILSQVKAEDFNMGDRAQCIAGHCDAHRGITQPTEICSRVFSNITDVSESLSCQVVYPAFNECDDEVRNATLPQAVKMLEILRDTGEVRWDMAVGLL